MGWNDHDVAGVITASEPSWIGPFTGLSPRQFAKLVTALRRDGADAIRKGRPWGLPLEDRALLIAVYWRTNLTMRQLAPLFGVSKSAADRIIGHLGSMLALQPRRRFRRDIVLIVDGTLVPTRDHTVAKQSKNHRYSINHQVVIDTDTRLVVVVGRPLPSNRNDCKAWEESGAKATVGNTMTIADGGYPGTGLVMPHRRRKGEELPDWKQAHNKSHKQVRARVEHTFARMKSWRILRDCRLKGDGVHHAMRGIARLQPRPRRIGELTGQQPTPPVPTRRSVTGQALASRSRLPTTPSASTPRDSRDTRASSCSADRCLYAGRPGANPYPTSLNSKRVVGCQRSCPA